VAIVLVATAGVRAAQTFDHAYAGYGDLLARHVKHARVDYRSLVADRAKLESVVSGFALVTPKMEQNWAPDERLAFWINAYNLFTLDAVVARYPIKGRFFSLYPRNSIRQIDGVWTKLTWRAAGREVTLDGIEHGIIRREFHEPLIHFAVNCASISCPPLGGEPYVASRLVQQLEDAARRYLASREGVRIDGRTLRLSSIFKWYGEDFVGRPQALRQTRRDDVERAVRAFLQKYGTPEVAQLAADPHVRLAYLPYDWSLNDVEQPPSP
jgi:hypothetical protein